MNEKLTRNHKNQNEKRWVWIDCDFVLFENPLYLASSQSKNLTTGISSALIFDFHLKIIVL
jgi:hypothetical protein